jgi:hypothetical protein
MMHLNIDLPAPAYLLVKDFEDRENGLLKPFSSAVCISIKFGLIDLIL